MMISIIAAMADNRVIGRGNRMPWHLPKDLEHFRALTLGHPVIMGRKTFESIGGALDGRTNIVITRQSGYAAEGCLVVHDLAGALRACGAQDEVFILGGAEVFREALPLAHRIYLTQVRTIVQGDAFFPEIPGEFIETGRKKTRDRYPLEFVVYERSGGPRRT